MDETPSADREQIERWILDGQHVLHALPAFLEQSDRGRTHTVEIEQELDRLRHEVAELRRENQQVRIERDEIAEAFNKLMSDVVTPMNEIATKIKVTPRRSPFERDPRTVGAPAPATSAAAPTATS